MSYIPDYRKQTDKLNDVDASFIGGYRMAVESIMSAFDSLDEDDLLSIEKEILEKFKASLQEFIEGEEVMVVCALFDKEEYADAELKDESSIFGIKHD